jgi:UDP-glucuronate 4-epimerase
MNIMVTGAGGFIGSHVCEALLERGDNVIGIDYLSSPDSSGRKKKNLAACFPNSLFRFQDVDLRNKKDLDWIFYKTKPDKIIHLAAKTNLKASIENPKLSAEVNVDATRNLLELSVKYKLRNFVFASTSYVYGSAQAVPVSEDDEFQPTSNTYAETKRKGEQLCKDFHTNSRLSVTILRFFSVYGPRCRPDHLIYRFAEHLAKDEPIQMHYEQKEFDKALIPKDFTYISDAVSSILLASDKNLDFGVFNISGGRPIKLNDLIRLMEIATGVKAKKQFIGKQEGEQVVGYADIRKARNILGYDPEVPIEEGIKRFVQWYGGEDTDLFYNI